MRLHVVREVLMKRGYVPAVTTLHSKDGSTFKGRVLVSGKISGLGVLTFSTNRSEVFRKAEGDWVDGMLNGQGKLYFRKVDAYITCEWKDGILQRSE